MDYALHLSVLLLIWASLALSQGLLTGYLGILAVHQAAAWAIGAYASAILDRTYGLPLGTSIIPSAMIAGAAMAGVIGLVSRGRRDDQVIASLCLQIIVVALITNLPQLTGGPLGIVGIGHASEFDQRARTLFCLIAAACVLGAILSAYLVLGRTRLPGEWIVVRDDRAFAESLGIDAGGARARAAFLAAAGAGAAGAVFAHYATFIEPNSFGLAESVAILAIAVIGRAPGVLGVLIASALIILAPEVLRGIGLSAALAANLRQGLFGIVLIVAIVRSR